MAFSPFVAAGWIRPVIKPPVEDESRSGFASAFPSFVAACADRIVVAFPSFEAGGLDRIEMAFSPFVAAGMAPPVIKPPSEDDDRERFASANSRFGAEGFGFIAFASSPFEAESFDRVAFSLLSFDAGGRLTSVIAPPFEDDDRGRFATAFPTFGAACADRGIVAFPSFEADGLDRIDMAFSSFVAAGWILPVIAPQSDDDDRE